MNIDGFWEIVDRVNIDSNGVMDEKCELLKEELMSLANDEIISFSKHFNELNIKAYSWELWAAAYILNGGCSDDSFSDFRATLISMGAKIFSVALKDPNSLGTVEFDDNDPCYEGYQYVINDVLEEKLGELPQCSITFPENPFGVEWDEDTVENLYPSLKCLDEVEPAQCNSEKNKPWWKFW